MYLTIDPETLMRHRAAETDRIVAARQRRMILVAARREWLDRPGRRTRRTKIRTARGRLLLLAQLALEGITKADIRREMVELRAPVDVLATGEGAEALHAVRHRRNRSMTLAPDAPN